MIIFTGLFGLMILGAIGFQIALILGAPWGRLTQGGQTDGPLAMTGRIAAAVSIIVLGLAALSVISSDGFWPNWPQWTAWVSFAVLSVSMIMNWITPSAPERRLWGPYTTLMVVLAAVVVWLS